jgi:hypothetical protein
MIGVWKPKSCIVGIAIELEEQFHFFRASSAHKILKANIGAEKFVQLMLYGFSFGIIDYAIISAVR